MVDVRIERLAKLGSYEWRETAPAKHLSLLWAIYRQKTRDISPAVD